MFPLCAPAVSLCAPLCPSVSMGVPLCVSVRLCAPPCPVCPPSHPLWCPACAPLCSRVSLRVLCDGVLNCNSATGGFCDPFGLLLGRGGGFSFWLSGCILGVGLCVSGCPSVLPRDEPAVPSLKALSNEWSSRRQSKIAFVTAGGTWLPTSRSLPKISERDTPLPDADLSVGSNGNAFQGNLQTASSSTSLPRRSKIFSTTLHASATCT